MFISFRLKREHVLEWVETEGNYTSESRSDRYYATAEIIQLEYKINREDCETCKEAIPEEGPTLNFQRTTEEIV